MGGGGAKAQPFAEERWFAHEDPYGAADHAVEAAYWFDSQEQEAWVFVTGLVTDGEHTRLAVWKYDAEAADGEYEPAEAEAVFPPDNFSLSGNTKGVGIAIDPANGDVYVTGYTNIQPGTANWPQWGSDWNYITIKYTKNLVLSSTWATGIQNAPGFRLYDWGGDEEVLDDKAVDILVRSGESETFVYVTGHSADSNKGLDVATLKYEADSGALSSTWAAGSFSYYVALGDGERRFDLDGGNDEAAQMGTRFEAESNEVTDPGNWIFVACTCFEDEPGGGNDDNDIVVVAYDPDGEHDTVANRDWTWHSHYDGGDHDVASGLAVWQISPTSEVLGVYACGYTMGQTGDYIALAYEAGDGAAKWTPEQRTWDGPQEGTDIALSCSLGSTGSQVALWVTGRTQDGSSFDVGTVVYEADSGDLECSRVVSGIETSTHGLGIAAFDDDPAAVVTGRTGGYALTFLLQLQSSGTTCDKIWEISYPSSIGVDYPSEAVHVIITASGIFVVGSATPGTLDALTIRYTEETP